MISAGLVFCVSRAGFAYVIGFPLGEKVDLTIFGNSTEVLAQKISVNGMDGQSYTYLTKEPNEKIFKFNQSELLVNGWELVNADVEKGLALYRKSPYFLTITIMPSSVFESPDASQVVINFVHGPEGQNVEGYDPFEPYKELLPRYPLGKILNVTEASDGKFLNVIILTNDNIARISSFYNSNMGRFGLIPKDSYKVEAEEFYQLVKEFKLDKLLDNDIARGLIEKAKFFRYVKKNEAECLVGVFELLPTGLLKNGENVRLIAINYLVDKHVVD